MTNSEKRRYVADAIRFYAHDSDESVYEFLKGYWPNELADLIDPTCHVVGTISQDCSDGSTVYAHELSCGHTCYTSLPEPPAYCDECGARVVSRNDQ
jgi:hypothetical protein